MVNTLTASITKTNVEGGPKNIGATFLHDNGKQASTFAASTLAVSPSQDLVVQPGKQNVSFNHGEKLDLTQLLAGAPLAHDLTNIGDFVKVLGHGRNDAGFGQGTKTTLEVTGPGGSAVVNLESSGKLGLKDLLSHNSLILPPH